MPRGREMGARDVGARRRVLSVGVCVALVLAGCWGGDDDDVGAPTDGAAGGGGRPRTGAAVGDGGGGPFTVRLSDGRAPDTSAAATLVAAVDGEVLSDDEVADVVARLSPFPAAEGDADSFVRPAEDLPRPRVGETVAEPFGSAASADPPPEVATGPLQVVRHQPDGDVAVAPFVSVTFDRPMVALGTLDRLAGEDVAVRVTPELEGRWRWIGTETLRFEHDDPDVDRLPGATEFTVEVPAGTTSADGATLDQAFTWRFTTPASRVLSVSGGEVVDRRPVLVATFDQRVDPNDVLATTTLRVGDEVVPLRLATADEVAGHDGARAADEAALPGRSVAFTTKGALAGGVEVTVEIGPGTPSAEGPLTSAEPFVHRTRTYAPLEVVRSECGGCRPGDALQLVFNNPLEPGSLDRGSLMVDPTFTVSADVYDATLVLFGATTATTTYAVTPPPTLRDVFGQELGEVEPVRFEIGGARPTIETFRERLVTADPLAGAPTVAVTSAGHETLAVALYAVTPADFAAYQELTEQPRPDGDLPPVPAGWRQVSSTEVAVAGDVDRPTETTIDLAPALSGPSGHVVVVVSSTENYPPNTEARWMNQPTMAWVQVTTLGLDALSDHDQLVAWATDLRDGTPLPDVAVRLDGVSERPVLTDASGLATLDLAAGSFLVAERDGETALLDAGWSGAWQATPRRDVARWYTFDDRGLYRPGEQLKVKGWVRRLTRSNDARIARVADEATVAYVVRDGFGNELASGDTALNATGGFDLAADLPLGAALGPAWVELDLRGARGLDETATAHQFTIEEVRRPELEVVTSAQSAEPHLVTEPVTVSATATYFAGGVLPDAPVTWQVSSRTTTYDPPNRPGFTFGERPPWWLEGAGRDSDGGRRGPAFGEDGTWPPEEEVEETTYRGRTDADGRHLLQLDFEGDRPDQPLTVSANAAVEDVNRQSVASTVDLLVHPSSRYVGVRSDRAFVRQGDPFEVEVVVTDLDGAAVAGHEVTVTTARIEERIEGGELVEVDVDPQTCEVTSRDEPVTCAATPADGGQHRITATVADDGGGRHRSELRLWVSGAGAIAPRGVDQELVTIVPDQDEHRPGDTAELLVVAPFSPAQGLLTLTRNGIEETQAFSVEDGSTTLEIPVTEDHVPGFDARVDLVGTTTRAGEDGVADPDLAPRPAYASGTVTLAVPATTKELVVSATPADTELEPGGTTTVALQVDDASGAPVAGAEVALVIVDEAVLSLVGYELPDPIAAFYQPLFDFLRTDHIRRTIQLDVAPSPVGGDDQVEEEAAAYDSEDAGEGSAASLAPTPSPRARAAAEAPAGTPASTPIAERVDFGALAVFAPEVPTGADGSATVEVTLPDNLTRYRVMAVAADDVDRFGLAESTITATLPLLVRPSPPRFVNFGDRFELPVVVQNLTDEPLDVDVVVETAGLALTGPVGRRMTVPAGDRVEVRFPAEADATGTARYRASAVSGSSADSASGELPAYTPATTEAFATYGVVDDGAVAQPLLTPTGVAPGFGGLELDTSSTAVQALTDAVVYLSEYPYQSADAYASRIIALASLRDVFAAFSAADAPSPAELDATVTADVAALTALQRDDGGFGTWTRSGPPDPYASVQATHALVVAGSAGYPVPGDAVDRALGRLGDVESLLPGGYDEDAKRTVRAYALHVRSLAGDRDPAKAEALYREDPAVPLDALAWLWPVVDDPAVAAAIAATVSNRVTETPGAATFAAGYEESAAALVLASDRRTDAIVLDALLSLRPDDPLVPKVVAGLLANQVAGRWGNVQENGFVLLAAERYFATFEAATPSFVARVWLGDTYAAEHAFEGRTIDTKRTFVPLAELGGDPDLVVAKDGPGRLYYRLGLRYAPDDLALAARDEGFVVDRTYEAVDDPGDVRREGGGWVVEPGAMVRVRLTMVADSARTNMALVDPLPAGLEIVNPGLASSPRPAPEAEPEGLVSEVPSGEVAQIDSSFPWSSWFDHQSFRDDRAQAFAARLPAGTYEWSYVARATTPGTFITPPTKAEEIYAPEVFGRSATDTVTVVG